MLAREFTYTDYNNEVRKETWYFNLSKAELMEMELSAYGGLESLMKRLIKEQKPEKVVEIFKEMILKSVGEKSMDGRRFIKNQQIREDFYQTEAYSDLFTELVTDGQKAVEFILGVIPADLAQKVKERESEEMAAPTEPAE